jgi:hypothetical protein
MTSQEILEKGVTFQEFIAMVRELQDKTDDEIALDIFFNRTDEPTRKIVNIMLEHNYRLVSAKIHP